LIDPDGHIYVLQAHDAQFPIESLAKLGEQMKLLPKSWQYRTRALAEDLVLDLGPDKTTPSEMNSINTGVVAQTAAWQTPCSELFTLPSKHKGSRFCLMTG